MQKISKRFKLITCWHGCSLRHISLWECLIPMRSSVFNVPGNIQAWEQPYTLSLAHGRFLVAHRKVCFYLPADNHDWHLCESFHLKAAPQHLAHGRLPQAWIWDCSAVCLFVNWDPDAFSPSHLSSGTVCCSNAVTSKADNEMQNRHLHLQYWCKLIYFD